MRQILEVFNRRDMGTITKLELKLEQKGEKDQLLPETDTLPYKYVLAILTRLWANQLDEMSIN
jgi:hypothetical protein